MKLSKAQQTVLNAVNAAQIAQNDSVAQDTIKPYMATGKLPHPNTLQSLASKELLSIDASKGYYAYWVSPYGKDFVTE